MPGGRVVIGQSEVRGDRAAWGLLAHRLTA
jgi:hypothetical protein